MYSQLIRHDLLQLEERLTDSLRNLLTFTAHAVYFPQDEALNAPVWIPEEHRLLLPLRQNGQLLGVFMARVDDEKATEQVESLLPALPGFLELAMDNLRLYKAARLDPLTGLATRHVLLERLDKAVAHIRETVLADGQQQDTESGGNTDDGFGMLGLVVISFAVLRDLVRETSHAFGDKVTASLAEALFPILPEDALAARSGDTEFAVLLPGADKLRCRNVAVEAVRAMQAVHLRHPATGRSVSLAPCAGFALFPQDMDGLRPQDVAEPAPILLYKAHLAAERLRSREARQERVMGYGDITGEGGEVLTVLPLGRLRVDLGRSEGASDGQRYSIWSTRSVQGSECGEMPEPLYKGEVVLLETREHDAVAEVLHLGDPAWLPEPGDTLLRLPEDHTAQRFHSDEEADITPLLRTDPITGLWRHGEFLTRLARQREGAERFTLVLVHVGLPTEADQPRAAQHMEQTMALAAEVCRTGFHEHGLESSLGGRFALNSLMFYLAGAGADTVERACTGISEQLNERFGHSGIGLFAWPFMDFHPADSVECCRKALEYALLLPAPHVGWFDSLAMTISADKLHCRGDVFGAMEEYKLALLADPDNALAWNSLGVCLAGLGRHAEARRHFEEALRRSPNDSALTYNLGAVCRNLGDTEAATHHFTRCLAMAPAHLYARIRLGQIARQKGDLEGARTLFEEAILANPESGLPQRHLASLALASGDASKARECLHEALLRNPRDAQALALMARLYLDNDEDPGIAETLARQSVALRPRLKAGWQQLARALETRGAGQEAREAALRAGEL